MCAGFPCKKYDNADKSDFFITHKNQFSDLAKATEIGAEAYKHELNAKVKILQKLLAEYDDGRRKSFYCLAVTLLKLNDIQNVMRLLDEQPENLTSIKEKAATAARLFQEIAKQNDIDLKLRKKSV